ncbi:hypothetical protein VNO77_11385 [Canavalia gladiata]|uniref:Uncharacterized protein n=1 Tax=Canavalia gladiata TaxID=3824 RepID=A0AAN9MGW3_CANGL
MAAPAEIIRWKLEGKRSERNGCMEVVCTPKGKEVGGNAIKSPKWLGQGGIRPVHAGRVRPTLPLSLPLNLLHSTFSHIMQLLVKHACQMRIFCVSKDQLVLGGQKRLQHD